MALVTVQRSPTASTSSSPCVSEAGSGEDDRHCQPRSISENFLTVKGAAVFLPCGNGSSPTSGPRITQRRNKHTGDLQQHLQTMFTLLRPEDTIRLAVRLENAYPQCTRYMVVVSTNGRQDTEESVVLGMDFANSDRLCTVGLVLPLWSDTLIHLDGDGGFSVSTVNRVHVFKPVSVQAMWSALQSLHKACEVARCNNYYPGSLFLTWVSYYQSRICSEQQYINEWNVMQDVQSHRTDSPVLFTDLPTERERTERLIKTRLREIMMQKDLENVTSKEIRTELEMQMVCNLREFKEFIDNEMIVILGQMDSPTEIFDHVYLGSEWNASNLEELQSRGVRYILNVTREIDNFFPGLFEYHNIRVYDEEATNLLEYWNDTWKFISKAKKAGVKCLVHCKMGVSRSASTVIAYAMKEYGWDLDTAFDHVKERRSVTKPNSSFMKQLEEYQGILVASKQRHNKLWRSHSDSDLSEQQEPLCKSPRSLGRSDPHNNLHIKTSSPPSIQNMLGMAVLQTLNGPDHSPDVTRSSADGSRDSADVKLHREQSLEDPLLPPVPRPRAATVVPEQNLVENCGLKVAVTLPISRPHPPPSLHSQPSSISPSLHSQPSSISPSLHSQPSSISPSLHSQPSSISPSLHSQPSSISPSLHSQPSSISPSLHSQPSSISPSLHSQPSSISPSLHSQPSSISPSLHSQPSSISPSLHSQPSSISPSLHSQPSSIPPSLHAPEPFHPEPEPKTDCVESSLDVPDQNESCQTSRPSETPSLALYLDTVNAVSEGEGDLASPGTPMAISPSGAPLALRLPSDGDSSKGEPAEGTPSSVNPTPSSLSTDSIDFFSAREKFLELSQELHHHSEAAPPRAGHSGSSCVCLEEPIVASVEECSSHPEDTCDDTAPSLESHHPDNSVCVRHMVTSLESISHPHNPQLQLPLQEQKEAEKEEGSTPPQSPSTPPSERPAGSVRRATEQLELRLRQGQESVSPRSALNSPCSSSPDLQPPSVSPTCTEPVQTTEEQTEDIQVLDDEDSGIIPDPSSSFSACHEVSASAVTVNPSLEQSSASSSLLWLEGVTELESDIDDPPRPNGCLARSSQDLQKIQETLRELQAFLYEAGGLSSQADPKQPLQSSQSRAGSEERVEPKAPAVWQRAMEIEARLRQAGLTPPSLMKRSASLAKLDQLELSMHDLNDWDFHSAAPCPDPPSSSSLSHSHSHSHSHSLAHCHDDVHKKQRFLPQSPSSHLPAAHQPEPDRTESSTHSSLSKHRQEGGAEHTSAPPVSCKATATQHAKPHPARRPRKAADKKKTVTMLYNTM